MFREKRVAISERCENTSCEEKYKLQYLKYISCGLILMAPQELIVNIFRKTTLTLYLMSLVGWVIMLSAMYGVFKITKRLIKKEKLELTLSAILSMFVGLSVEWGIIGNSPWANPGANQLGLVAGWVSVFILPRAFLEDKYDYIRKWTKIWYFPFVLSLFFPLMLFSEKGPVIGVMIYGYSVIPFLVLSMWYVYAKWKPIQENT